MDGSIYNSSERRTKKLRFCTSSTAAGAAVFPASWACKYAQWTNLVCQALYTQVVSRSSMNVGIQISCITAEWLHWRDAYILPAQWATSSRGPCRSRRAHQVATLLHADHFHCSTRHPSRCCCGIWPCYTSCSRSSSSSSQYYVVITICTCCNSCIQSYYCRSWSTSHTQYFLLQVCSMFVPRGQELLVLSTRAEAYCIRHCWSICSKTAPLHNGWKLTRRRSF